MTDADAKRQAEAFYDAMFGPRKERHLPTKPPKPLEVPVLVRAAGGRLTTTDEGEE